MDKAYRLNVGIVVFNAEGKVLLCARADQKDLCWQFPQGGIEKQENIEAAARRELYEETGLKEVKLIFIKEKATRYDFPSFIKVGKFKGQEQFWVLFYFDGKNNEINFNINPEEIEFKDYQWADITLAPKLIVDFKKGVYREVAACFKPIIDKFFEGK